MAAMQLLASLASKAKALALNVTEIELRVMEATNEEPWGPHGQAMQEIARAAEDPEKYNLIMNVISERLQMRDENWRLCYKALLLLEFLVKHGPLRVVDELNQSVSSLERLRDNFEYKDPQGKDHGINVRQRAGELASLVSNIDKVKAERERAAKNAGKYKGVSSSDVRSGTFSAGNGGFGSGTGGFGSSSGGFGYGSSGFGTGSGSGGGYGSAGGGGYGSSGASGANGSTSAYDPSPIKGEASGKLSVPKHSASSGSLPSAPTGLASGGAAGAGATLGEEDPFEATRKRIERLRAEGALPEPPTAPLPPGLMDPAAAGKVPKKLKDVKINPAVAATFANLSVTPASSTNSLGKLTAPTAPSSTNNSALDLLADLEVPPPQQLQAAASTEGNTDWDAFGAAPASSAVPWPVPSTTAMAAMTPASSGLTEIDLFSGLASAASAPAPAAPLPVPPKAASMASFNSLLDFGTPTPAPAPAIAVAAVALAAPAPPRPAAAAFDPFGELAAVPATAAVAPSAAFDPFGGFAATPAPAAPSLPVPQALDPFGIAAGNAGGGDPFSFMAAPQLAAPTIAPAAKLPGAPMAGGLPQLGAAAKSNDPFAGLGF